MTFPVTADFTTASQNANYVPAYFIKSFRTGTFEYGFCTLARDYYTQGVTFNGLGGALIISHPEYDSHISKTSLNITLNGVDNTAVQKALADDLHKYTMEIFFGYVNTEDNVDDGDTVLIYKGRIDDASFVIGDTTATVTFTLESDRSIMEKSSVLYNAEQVHKVEYPNDTFYDGLSVMNDFQFIL